MNTHIIIFDLDGTILNTYSDIAAATNYALAKRGYPTHSVEVIKSFVGNGINKLFERALPEGHKTQADVLDLRSDFVPYYNAHGTEKTFVFDGIKELMQFATAKGIRLAVASNKYQQATQALIPHFFPEIDFIAVFGQREGVPVKPDPTIVHDILKQAGIDALNALYIGDSGVDMQTARNAGVRCVGVTWGCRSRAELESFAPYAVVDTTDEIIEIIRKLG